MIPANETFNGTFPFQANYFTGRGFKMHYVDEGEGEVILCLHGQPTWGYLYRNFIPYLSKVLSGNCAGLYGLWQKRNA